MSDLISRQAAGGQNRQGGNEMMKYMFVYIDKDGEYTHALFYDTFAEAYAVEKAFREVGFKETEMYVRVDNEYKKMD